MSQQKWSPEKKALMRQVRYRLEDDRRYRKEIDALRQERKQYQEHFARRFKWWIKLSGENSTPSLPWLIEQDAKFLQTVSRFLW